MSELSWVDDSIAKARAETHKALAKQAARAQATPDPEPLEKRLERMRAFINKNPQYSYADLLMFASWEKIPKDQLDALLKESPAPLSNVIPVNFAQDVEHSSAPAPNWQDQDAIFAIKPRTNEPETLAWNKVTVGAYSRTDLLERNKCYGINLADDDLCVDSDPRNFPDGRNVLAESLS